MGHQNMAGQSMGHKSSKNKLSRATSFVLNIQLNKYQMINETFYSARQLSEDRMAIQFHRESSVKNHICVLALA